jgi:hypothetical protein
LFDVTGRPADDLDFQAAHAPRAWGRVRGRSSGANRCACSL